MRIIGGLNRGCSLQMPKGSQTRPTAGRLRQALFNICQHYIEDTRVLDLFAGSGAVGFEALSRGAAFATFVESNKEAFNCIKKNANHLQVEECCQILHGDVFAMLKKLEREHASYGIIYADPPYGKFRQNGSTSLLFSTEAILWVDTHQLLEPGGSLFIEEDLRYAPQPTQLTTLQLHDSRRFGQSILQHYKRTKDIK